MKYFRLCLSNSLYTSVRAFSSFWENWASHSHTFSIGFKSGERAGHFQTLWFLSLKNILVTFEVVILLKNNLIDLYFDA